MSTIKRQFIAAARCPACQAVDRIRRCYDPASGREWIECVACAYQEDRPTPPDPAPSHPQTEERAAVIVQPAKLR